MIDRGAVERAREAIGGRLHRTPLFSSVSLGPAIHLKAELFQRTGSFKPRGVLTKLASLTDDERKRGVIGISAGNHAQALAYCAALEKLDALVVMWTGASEQKIAATRGYGARVDLNARDPGGAFDRLAELMDETGRVLVHPFDDALVIAGQGTVGLEILEDLPDLESIVVPCGGGGLVAGIAAASEGRRVYAVEPELSPALHRGLQEGEPVRVEPQSIADGLSAPFAGEHALEICAERGVESVLVTEDEIVAGMRFLYTRAKLACEPAGAVGVAAFLAGKISDGNGRMAIVVSGGNVAPETAAAILSPR